MKTRITLSPDEIILLAQGLEWSYNDNFDPDDEDNLAIRKLQAKLNRGMRRMGYKNVAVL
ncbi:MAG: hypothetical protein LN413_00555 [Candidatus Thermoplasmatota archaeon]|nr:hypothetical protein [Candidatus Thermoplasmatota archaeon]